MGAFSPLLQNPFPVMAVNMPGFIYEVCGLWTLNVITRFIARRVIDPSNDGSEPTTVYVRLSLVWGASLQANSGRNQRASGASRGDVDFR